MNTCSRLDEHAKERKSFTKQAYAPGLKGPGPLGRIDFGNPALKPMLRMMADNMKKDTRAYHPPEGLRLRSLSVDNGNGRQIWCFVMEPEGEETRSLPGMLYCHGGGFFLPLQVPALRLAAKYAAALHMRIFLPEYRLLPEHPAPAAFDDCLAVWRQMIVRAEVLRLDATKILLYGESAGGALAAGMAQQLLAECDVRPVGQLLIYPVLDDRCGRYASMEQSVDVAWPRSSNEQMWREYLRDITSPAAPLVPLRTDYSALAGLPPAYIEPQEIDILHDEAVTYAEALTAAGITVQLNEVSGSYHGFDAESDNAFVSRVIQRRLCAMKTMLESSSRQPRP